MLCTAFVNMHMKTNFVVMVKTYALFAAVVVVVAATVASLSIK